MGEGAGSNIILVGFSCTGKSRTGRLVAEELGFGFVDTDDLIVWEAGKSIARIFAEEGEPYFRDLESWALERACQKEGMVIATGGGIVLREKNRALMRRRGFVILLEAASETIYRRNLEDPTRRPLLDGKDLAQVAAFKEERQPYYEGAKHWALATDSLGHAQVAQEVIRAWNEWKASPSAG